jgi:hypothetical protein
MPLCAAFSAANHAAAAGDTAVSAATIMISDLTEQP